LTRPPIHPICMSLISVYTLLLSAAAFLVPTCPRRWSCRVGSFRVVFIAPFLQPAFREPSNANVITIALPRELTGSPSSYRSKASNLRRIRSTLLAIGQQLLRSEKFLFSMPDHEIASIPTFLVLRYTMPYLMTSPARTTSLSSVSFCAFYIAPPRYSWSLVKPGAEGL
jgi:hypothetical protein